MACCYKLIYKKQPYQSWDSLVLIFIVENTLKCLLDSAAGPRLVLAVCLAGFVFHLKHSKVICISLQLHMRSVCYMKIYSLVCTN